MKRVLITLLCLVLALCLVGCGGEGLGSDDTAADSPSVDDTAAVDTTEAKESESAKDTGPEEPDLEASIALNSFRNAMMGTSQRFAVAYLGYGYDFIATDIAGWVEQTCPSLCEDLPFISSIPEANTARADLGEVYCIVPLDESATVAVNRVVDSLDGTEVIEEVAYRSETGEPILVVCNGGGLAPDTQVNITDNSGYSMTWYPNRDVNGFVSKYVEGANEELILDFTPYANEIKNSYRFYLDDMWKKPTATDLVGTSWEAHDYPYDGREVSYYLDFASDTVTIQWNDGYDVEPHVFTAPWSIKEVDGVCMIELDLGNLDGIRNYCILIGTDADMLCFMQDFVNDDIRSYERAIRIMQRTYG